MTRVRVCPLFVGLAGSLFLSLVSPLPSVWLFAFRFVFLCVCAFVDVVFALLIRLFSVPPPLSLSLPPLRPGRTGSRVRVNEYDSTPAWCRGDSTSPRPHGRKCVVHHGTAVPWHRPPWAGACSYLVVGWDWRLLIGGGGKWTRGGWQPGDWHPPQKETALCRRQHACCKAAYSANSPCE